MKKVVIVILVVMLFGFTYDSLKGMWLCTTSDEASIWWKSNEVSLVNVFDGAYYATGTAKITNVYGVNDITIDYYGYKTSVMNGNSRINCNPCRYEYLVVVERFMQSTLLKGHNKFYEK